MSSKIPVVPVVRAAKGDALDVNTMPLADLKELCLREGAEAEALSANGAQFNGTVEAEPEEVPRWMSASEYEHQQAQKARADEAVPTEFEAERIIDLEDGSGKQVFRATGATPTDAWANLSEKLAEAQRHATRKIREQAQRINELDAQRQAKEDAEYINDKTAEDRLRRQPVKTVEEISERTAKRVVEAEQQRQANEQEVVRRSREIQEAWVGNPSNAAYVADQHNGALMMAEIEASIRAQGKVPEQVGITTADIDAAFVKLSRAGKLHLRDVPARANTNRGSSFRNSGGSPSIKTGPSEADLYAMPMSDLRKLADSQMAEQAQKEAEQYGS